MKLAAKREIKRKLFHCLLLIYAFGFWFLDKTTVIIGLSIAIAGGALFEVLRFKVKVINDAFCRYCHGIYRSEEVNRISAFIGTIGGALITVIVFPNRYMVFASFLYLAFGDSAAALIGRSFGKHKIASAKTLEGSFACFLACFIVGLFLFNPLFAFLGALLASIVEAFDWRRLPIKNDNFWMQIINAAVLTLLSAHIKWS
ncbi:MAG: hypothetical protein LBB93_00045 [Elusimicrobiota bacterium]|jgi:dolichol kinase|nr:hypothetical protein [Elusimicrobiota bacterium]